MKRRIGSWIVCIVLVAAPVCGWANAGDLDPTFGNNGIVITPIGNSGDNDEIAALVLQPDGKLVAAGYTAHLGVAKYDVAVVRYGADGSLDPTFGNGGKVTTAIGSAFDRAHALVLQPDGKLVAAGSTYNQATNYDFALVRYNSDGSLDATFGSNGKVTTSIAGGADEAFALVLQPDGKLVAAGYANQGATSNDFALARYSASGALDPTFGNGGIVTTPVIRGSDQIYALGLQPDGKLVAAGTGGVARYLAGGGLDDTFGNGGLVAAPINTLARALVLQPDGKLVMAGLYYDPVAGANFRVVRYAANGALDDTFGSGGIANTAFPNANVACRALALMPDGRLVAAGQSGGNFALARYSRNGKPDFTFGAGGKLVTPPYAAAALVLQPDAKLVAAGSSYSGGRLDFGLARYMSGICGNAIIEAGEECDDANLVSGDGCDANCTFTACGNGIMTAGEACDDGNSVDGDGCDADCLTIGCGNGAVDPGEECDDANATNGDGCDNNCTKPRCGNGIIAGWEQCDDGNRISGDGCDANCTRTGCGNGIVSAGEECDDSNRTSGDGCDGNCTRTRCGNGVVTAGEECDDGNAVDGDGCQANCTLTARFDTVLLPPRPLAIRIGRGKDVVKTRVRVKLRDAGPPASGPTGAHTVQLTAQDGDCPAGTIAGLPDFDRVTLDAQDTVNLLPGKSATADVPLAIAASAFTSFNRKGPTRCTLRFAAATVLPAGSIDPVTVNDRAGMELNVVDRHDPDQTAFHEVVMVSLNPVTVRIGKGTVQAVRKIHPRVGSADLGEAGGHTSSIQVSNGDCPVGTVGPADFDAQQPGTQSFATVRGGKTMRADLQLTLNASAFQTLGAASPTRCTATLTATGPGGDTDATNSSATLVIDVIDANDF